MHVSGSARTPPDQAIYQMAVEFGRQMAASGWMVVTGAGAGIMGAAVVLGLTTDSGAIDWIGIVTATAGLIMVLTGLFRVYRPGAPHTG
jgi:predicted Rossmann-fold nucleotide-binding protein